MLDDKAVASLAHPARLAALAHIACAPASPEDIAHRTGLRLGTIAYHVRWLSARGLVVLDHEERIRGAVKHVYRLNPANGLSNDLRRLALALEALAGDVSGEPAPSVEDQIDVLSRAALTPAPEAQP